jgi:Ca2+/Na+ antiporter
MLGIIILINPFDYNLYNLYVTAVGMFLAGIFVVVFMNSEHNLSKKEGLFLLFFYIVYIILEFIVTTHLNIS